MMYAERFPIQWPSGIHGIPITHLGQLGLKIDDLDMHPRNGGEILSRYEHHPEKHVTLAADSGDHARDKAAVLYGKTTIQHGDGPYTHAMPVAPNDPSWLMGAHEALLRKGIGAHDGEVIADDGAQKRPPGRHDWLFDPQQQQQRVQELDQGNQQLQQQPVQQPLQATGGWHMAGDEPFDPDEYPEQSLEHQIFRGGKGHCPQCQGELGMTAQGQYHCANCGYVGGETAESLSAQQKMQDDPNSITYKPPTGNDVPDTMPINWEQHSGGWQVEATVMTQAYLNGKPLKQGDTIYDFRGDPDTFLQVTRDPFPGKSGKILVGSDPSAGREYYVEVFPGVELITPDMPGHSLAPDAPPASWSADAPQGDTPEQIEQMVKGGSWRDYVPTWEETKGVGQMVKNDLTRFLPSDAPARGEPCPNCGADGVHVRMWQHEPGIRCGQCMKHWKDGYTEHPPFEFQQSDDPSEWQHEGGRKLADMSTGVMPQPGQQPMGGTCPNCGNPLGVAAQQDGVCPTCRTMTSQQGGSTQQSPVGPATTQVMPAPHQPPPGMSPRDPGRLNIAHRDDVRGEMDYSQFHIADVAPTDNSVEANPVPAEQPGTNDGPFNDGGDMGEMSTDQHGAFQKTVNTAIDLLNNAAQQGLPLDISAVTAQLSEQGFPNSQKAAAYALQQPTDESGMRSYPANNDPVPDPSQDPSGVGQGAQPSAVGGGATDQVLSPMEQPSNGAFAHVKLPNGKVGHVTDTYKDMWDSEWVRVADTDGGAHNILAEQVEPVEAPASADPVSELQAFIDAWPAPQGTAADVADHMSRIRSARQYIRRQMKNSSLSHNQRTALDKIDAELQYASVASGQAVIERNDAEQEYVNTLVNSSYRTGFSDGESVGGVEIGIGLDLPEEIPVVPPSAIERVQEEHPEVLVDAMTSSVRSDLTAVTQRAIDHISKYTAGYPQDVRDEHEQRFVIATQDAATAYREPATPTTKTASAVEPSDWDGPVEAIFMGSL